jgi:hypothetical protein
MPEKKVVRRDRKNRRQALGLLLGVGALAPAAMAQRTIRAKRLSNDLVLLIGPNGKLETNKDLQISISENDRLVLVNLANDPCCFQFATSQFVHKIEACETVPAKGSAILPLKSNAVAGKYTYSYEVGNPCPKDCKKKARDGGDIIIDP